MKAPTLGQSIRQARLARKLTLRHLADLSMVSPTFISLVENDKQPTISALTLDTLAQVLGVEGEQRRRWFFLAKKLPPEVTNTIFRNFEQFDVIATMGNLLAQPRRHKTP